MAIPHSTIRYRMGRGNTSEFLDERSLTKLRKENFPFSVIRTCYSSVVLNYYIKPSRVGDFGAKVYTYYFNFSGTYRHHLISKFLARTISARVSFLCACSVHASVPDAHVLKSGIWNFYAQHVLKGLRALKLD